MRKVTEVPARKYAGYRSPASEMYDQMAEAARAEVPGERCKWLCVAGDDFTGDPERFRARTYVALRARGLTVRTRTLPDTNDVYITAWVQSGDSE